MLLWQKLKMASLEVAIAYHRRKADSYNQPVISRSTGPDRYVIWMRNMGIRHNVRARQLERQVHVMRKR